MKHIIYHQSKPDRPEEKGTDCPDGILAAWVAWKAHPDATIWGWAYNTPAPDFFQPGDEVFIVDFSFAIPTVLEWEQQGVKVTLIDHHETAAKAFEEFQNIEKQVKLDFRFDMAECGCTLAWKEFFPDKPLPLMLQYARERDIWTKLLPQTDVVHNGLSSLRKFYGGIRNSISGMPLMHHQVIRSHSISQEFAANWDKAYAWASNVGVNPGLQRDHKFLMLFTLFEVLSKLDDSLYFEIMLEAGRRAYANRMAIAWQAAGRYQYRTIAGYRVPIVFTRKEEDYAYSDICQALYDGLFPDVPFVAMVFADCVSVSLRSGKNGINVGEIAQQFGGGGKIHAAGFKLDPPLKYDESHPIIVKDD
jgi:oligoribonuclease NrnB/cAMP/cGMP phosphodiesterase (DHH superfamily)